MLLAFVLLNVSKHTTEERDGFQSSLTSLNRPWNTQQKGAHWTSKDAGAGGCIATGLRSWSEEAPLVLVRPLKCLQSLGKRGIHTEEDGWNLSGWPEGLKFKAWKETEELAFA